MGWCTFLRDYGITILKLVAVLVTSDMTIRSLTDNSYPFSAFMFKYTLKGASLSMSTLLVVCACVCMLVLLLELMGICAQSTQRFTLLRVYVCVNSVIITSLLCLCVVLGYVSMKELDGAVPTSLSGEAFSDFDQLQSLMDELRERKSISGDQNNKLWTIQRRIDAIQELYKCCAENSWQDWTQRWMVSDADGAFHSVVGSAHPYQPAFWFRDCYATHTTANQCLVPRSCCIVQNSDCNMHASQFYNRSCKGKSVDLTETHLLVSIMLLTITLVLTTATALFRWALILTHNPHKQPQQDDHNPPEMSPVNTLP